MFKVVGAVDVEGFFFFAVAVFFCKFQVPANSPAGVSRRTKVPSFRVSATASVTERVMGTDQGRPFRGAFV